MIDRFMKALFGFAALYDGLLGLAFLIWADRVFAFFQVTPPNHIGYVHFPALLLLMFAWLFLNIARNPLANRHLIIYGIWLKATYCGVVFWHEFTTGIPDMWIPWAWADLVFLVLFIWAFIKLNGSAALESQALDG